MSLLFSRTCILLLSISSAATAAVQVTSVEPSSGPTAGGNVVTIHGAGFCGGGTCGWAEVYFVGYRAADVQLLDDSTIRATVPPGFLAVGGSTPVLVNGEGGTGSLTDVYTYRPSSPTDYERIFLPISTTAAGAYGSLWITEGQVASFSSSSHFLFWEPGNCRFCGPSIATLTPHINGTINSNIAETSATPAVMFYVSPKPAHDDVNFDLLLRNDAVRREKWGTEIPVVRERDFRTGATELMNITLDPQFRVMLRVYDVDNVQDGANTQVIVRRFVGQGGSNQLVDERTLDVKEIAARGEFPAFPGFASMSDVTADVATTSGAVMRVEIEPLTPGLRYWAFVSVTNNSTQDVTVISPH